MNPAVTHTDPHLVIDTQADKTVFVFLLREPDPARCPGLWDEPVALALLPPHERFGRPGEVSVARPVLGRRADGLGHFREFQSTSDLLRAGYVPVPHYRVCDCWHDYHTPWSAFAPEPATDRIWQDDHDE
jgi:hypothetical protein